MSMKKFSKLFLFLSILAVLLSACSPKAKEEITIGIVQFDEHPALDDARKGFEDGLKELGLEAKISYQNAQREISASTTISEKFVKDKVDLIYAIATPSAQTAKKATDEIPILFSAVTAPVEDGLIESMDKPGGNITGTSDEAPIDRQLQLFIDIKPDIKKIGILFNTSEPNSQAQIEMAKKVGQGMGLEIIASGINNINDVPQATESLIKKVDGIYTITDNMVASAINLVAKKALENNMITVAAEESHIAGGILVTDGLSYYELGRQTAQMAKEILLDGKSPSIIPSAKAKNTRKAFNEESLKALNLDENNKAFQNAIKIQ